MNAQTQWTEVLRCATCGLTGVACLAQPNNLAPIIVINKMPAGFTAIASEYGDTFFCEACNRPAT
jgi:hypothetical protein